MLIFFTAVCLQIRRVPGSHQVSYQYLSNRLSSKSQHILASSKNKKLNYFANEQTAKLHKTYLRYERLLQISSKHLNFRVSCSLALLHPLFSQINICKETGSNHRKMSLLYSLKDIGRCCIHKNRESSYGEKSV